jgi:hypothetical protein
MPALPPGKQDWTMVWARICYLLDALAGQVAPGASTLIGYETILKPGESATIPISAVVGQQPYPNFTGEPGAYRFYIPLQMIVLGASRDLSPEESVSIPFTLLPSP